MKLLVFSAKWCVPCRHLHTVIDQYIEEHPAAKDQIEFIDVERGDGQKLAESFNISSIPTLFIIKDEDESCPVIRRSAGGMSLRKFSLFVEGCLP